MTEPPVKGNASRATRPYRSPKREQRAQETRRRIRDAASRLFLRDGYATTTMSAIAREAEVGERTVYLAFPTKPALLNEIITVAVRGGDEDAPLAARDAWQEVLAAPGDQILARLADALQAIFARTAPVLEVAEAAAASNPDLAARRERGQRNMRADFREVADALDRAGALAAKVTPADAADTIYALAGHDVYLRLTRECGWTGTRYAAWLADTLAAALTRSARRR
jgi:AcrR family transcriptional regulator